MRTVTLELLRHGPAHNQLLSPLTPYLALCENHAPVTLTVPFEHNQFLHRLDALTYELQEKHRQFQINDTGRELGRLLGAIPGLTAELSREPCKGQAITHLRLILSASELALLPFELALAGNGFPGAGQPLLLQSELPICLTREVRRISTSRVRWACDPRVLFVCASPEGLPAVPLESHLLALRRAVNPWVPYHEPEDDAARHVAIDKRLTVLPRASIEDIEDACAEGRYTHVHILAHGVARKVGFDVRFGLALHEDADHAGGVDVVSGERLATALRAMKQPGLDELACPMVVTLASCNSGNVGSVVGAGASIAHALQEAGVPLVVAGQFPLTFEGSVELVERMYGGLLWGTDPRELLMDLRRRLHTQRPDNHDWAALTAYAALPQGFERQVHVARVEAAKRAIDNSMDFTDRATRRVMRRRGHATKEPVPPGADDKAANDKVLREAHERIEVAKLELVALVGDVPDEMRSEVLGLLASAEKRHAEVAFWAKGAMLDFAVRTRYLDDVDRLLQRSKQAYWSCFRASPDLAWTLVQYLTLSLLLDGRHPSAEIPQSDEAPTTSVEREGRSAVELWHVAFTLSLNDLDATPERVGWALGNLIELSLLAQILDISPSPGAEPWPSRAVRWAQLLLMTRTSTFQLYSTRRQLVRFAEWYPQLSASSFAAFAKQADDLVERLSVE